MLRGIAAQKARIQNLPLDSQGLGPGAQGTVKHAPFEWVHGCGRDSLGNDLQLTRTVDPCNRIDELEIQRSVHDAFMTVSVVQRGDATLSNRRAEA